MLHAYQEIGKSLLLRYLVKSCDMCKIAYCTNRTAKRRTKTKKQKLYQKHEVVRYVAEYFEENAKGNKKSVGVLDTVKKDLLHLLQTNPSQMLGFNIEELSKRVDVFRAAGMSFNDSISLSLLIPSSLHINNNNFKNVIKCLQKYGLCAEEIIHQHPYVGAFEHVQLEKNLKYLTDANLKSTLSTLISQHPILLAYQLNKTTVGILDMSSDENRTITDMEMPLNTGAVQNKIVKQLLQNEKPIKLSRDAKEFFANYDIDIKKLYQVCPDIFVVGKETLEKSLDCVLSAPFYFEVSDVEKLIMTHPHVFVMFHQDNVTSQVQYLEEISTSQGRLYKLLTENAEIFRDPETFFRRVALFKKFRFKDADVGRLLAQKGAVNCFIDCDDYTDETLTQLLKLYFSYKKRDLKPIQIIYSSPICLSSKAFDIIKPRLMFLRQHGKVKDITQKRKTKKEHLTLQRIIKSSVHRFVELCGSTLEEFQEFSE